MNKLIVFLSIFLFIGVANGDSYPLKVGLKVNEKASIDKGNLIIHLVRIVEDKRCPANVDCYWSGYVKAEVTVTAHKVDYGHHFIANIHNDSWNLSNEIILGKYILKLGFAAVSPDRIIKEGKERIAEIKQADYTVELTVDHKL